MIGIVLPEAVPHKKFRFAWHSNGVIDKPKLRALFVFCVRTPCTVTAYGQATVSGRVTDPDGAIVQGIDVRLERSGTLIVHGMSDDCGQFHVAQVSPGRYVLHIPASEGYVI